MQMLMQKQPTLSFEATVVGQRLRLRRHSTALLCSRWLARNQDSLGVPSGYPSHALPYRRIKTCSSEAADRTQRQGRRSRVVSTRGHKLHERDKRLARETDATRTATTAAARVPRNRDAHRRPGWTIAGRARGTRGRQPHRSRPHHRSRPGTKFAHACFSVNTCRSKFSTYFTARARASRTCGR